jgi:hypothetical protein
MVRTTVGTIAEAELSVQQAESITTINASQSSTVNSGSSERTVVTAPSGTILRVLALRFFARAPSGASSGDHSLNIQGPATNVSYLVAQSDFSNEIVLNQTVIKSANLSATPTTEEAQSSTIRSLQSDDSQGIVLEYSNDTDVDQTESRDITIVAIEQGVS